MSRNIFFNIVIFLCLISCAKPQSPVKPHIIPIPNELEIHEGVFTLQKNTPIHADSSLVAVAEFFNAYVEEKLGNRLSFQDKPTAKAIHFIHDESLENDEAYTLSVTTENIKITSKTPQGAFYGIQTLRQLLPATFESDKIQIQNIHITDAPRFAYRGMHLDVARHFFSVDFIKKYIDILSQLKMNTFHWHLTDDQGWRIEIKKYPKLQEIAAFRNETLIGHYNDFPQQFDGKKYGGFYTQEEVKEIVKYASERFVTVIPEIEMPGHAQAAIAAYPALGCTEKAIEVATKWGVFEDIYCPKEATFTFLENVLDEVMLLFPSKYIHIGGDEAPKTRWKACSHCQQLIEKEHLKDAHGLQSYFITRMEKYVNRNGKQIIGWDEILEGGLAPNATVMSWRGTNGAVVAAKSGHHVIMSPTSHSYFDYYQSDNEDEPLAIGGYLPLEKVYSFEPIPKELSKKEASYVLGAQGNVWTEYITTPEKVAYMAFPRAIAMAEVTWSNPKKRDYQDFAYRLSHFHKYLDAQNINYANHLYEIEGNVVKRNDQLVFDLQTVIRDKTIRYTTDGSSPTIQSKKYESYLPIEGSTTLKAAVFDDTRKLGRDFSLEYNEHKAVGATIRLKPEPSKTYAGSGKTGLINGISGSNTRYGDTEWLGFFGKDVLITLDFDEPTKINTVSTRFYNANGQWIYAPKSIAVTYYTEENEATTTIQQIEPNGILPEVIVENELTVNRLVIRIENYGIIPEGKQGAGNKAWTFIDEIVVK